MNDCVSDFCALHEVKGESSSTKDLTEVYLDKKFKWDLI